MINVLVVWFILMLAFEQINALKVTIGSKIVIIHNNYATIIKFIAKLINTTNLGVK